MIDAPRGKRPASLINLVLTRLSARIAPLVQTELAGALIAELERYLDEQLLSEVQKRVETIIDRELPGRIRAIIDSELPTKNPLSANEILVDRFTRVFDENLWGDSETVSGWGSRRDSSSVAAAISALNLTKEKIDFISINDIPCGDFNWIEMFLASVPEICYRGFDIVPAMIERNKKLHPSYKFQILDITSALPPRADLIFSKDFFNHLTYADISRALMNMKNSNSTYLLASNNFGFTNEELPANAGECSRHLDLCSQPFRLPLPTWRTNYMGLWKFSDINLAGASVSNP